MLNSCIDQVSIYLLIVNNRNTRTRSEICSKLTKKTPEWHQALVQHQEKLTQGRQVQVVCKTKIRDIKVIANLFFKSIVGLFQIN